MTRKKQTCALVSPKRSVHPVSCHHISKLLSAVCSLFTTGRPAFRSVFDIHNRNTLQLLRDMRFEARGTLDKYIDQCIKVRMSRAPTSRARRSGNLILNGSNPDPAGLNLGWFKPMTFNLIIAWRSALLVYRSRTGWLSVWGDVMALVEATHHDTIYVYVVISLVNISCCM